MKKDSFLEEELCKNFSLFCNWISFSALCVYVYVCVVG